MYRHELKYLINNYQIEILKMNLKGIMSLDSNYLNGEYFIRSLYFDDYHFTSFNEVINGISKRSKYRIRYYNYDPNYIKLEKKAKVNNLGKKTSAFLTKEQVIALIKNQTLLTDEPLINELKSKIQTKLLKGVVIVDYQRIAFVEKTLNVRITIDYNISCCYNIEAFFKQQTNNIPLLDKNMAIVEVKYDAFLPDYIKQAINIKDLELTSFSKYANAIAVLDKVKGVDNI